MMINVAILTVSTRGSKGERKTDASGEIIKELVQKIDGKVVDYKIIADDKRQVIWELKRLAEAVKADLIVTTGGTGLSPTDVTPDATLEVIEKRVPGFEEVMRTSGLKKTPFAILSRAVVGTYESSLIVNLPGNPNGVRDSLESIMNVIPHAVKVLKGGPIQDQEHTFIQKK